MPAPVCRRRRAVTVPALLLLSALAAGPGAELRWGADAQGGAPYVFQDPMDPNHLIGFEVDLAEALAAELGVTARRSRASGTSCSTCSRAATSTSP